MPDAFARRIAEYLLKAVEPRSFELLCNYFLEYTNIAERSDYQNHARLLDLLTASFDSILKQCETWSAEAPAEVADVLNARSAVASDNEMISDFPVRKVESTRISGEEFEALFPDFYSAESTPPVLEIESSALEFEYFRYTATISECSPAGLAELYGKIKEAIHAGSSLRLFMTDSYVDPHDSSWGNATLLYVLEPAANAIYFIRHQRLDELEHRRFAEQFLEAQLRRSLRTFSTSPGQPELLQSLRGLNFSIQADTVNDVWLEHHEIESLNDLLADAGRLLRLLLNGDILRIIAVVPGKIYNIIVFEEIYRHDARVLHNLEIHISGGVDSKEWARILALCLDLNSRNKFIHGFAASENKALNREGPYFAEVQRVYRGLAKDYWMEFYGTDGYNDY